MEKPNYSAVVDRDVILAVDMSSKSSILKDWKHIADVQINRFKVTKRPIIYRDYNFQYYLLTDKPESLETDNYNKAKSKARKIFKERQTYWIE